MHEKKKPFWQTAIGPKISKIQTYSKLLLIWMSVVFEYFYTKIVQYTGRTGLILILCIKHFFFI